MTQYVEGLSCTGKLAFETKVKARMHLRSKRIAKKARFLSEYKCPFCRDWHFGHRGKKK